MKQHDFLNESESDLFGFLSTKFQLLNWLYGIKTRLLIANLSENSTHVNKFAVKDLTVMMKILHWKKNLFNSLITILLLLK